MDKWKRSERVALLTKALVERPHHLFSLTEFSELLQAAKSSLSEDIAIINEGRVIYNGTVDELLQAAEGRVFTMTASKRELPELKRQLTITSMHTQGNKVHIRFIADTLMQGAKACEPNIEDAYMLYLHSSGVREILGEIGGEW